jgi:hypothetical protein
MVADAWWPENRIAGFDLTRCISHGLGPSSARFVRALLGAQKVVAVLPRQPLSRKEFQDLPRGEAQGS